MSDAPTAYTAPTFGTPVAVWPGGALLGEGTCWSPREQALYWVDILGMRLHRLHPASGARRSWVFDETVSTVAERRDAPGLILTLRHDIAFFDPASARLQRLHRPEPDLPGNRFNDGKCDAAGRFWAGTMDFACEAPTGSLYCVRAAGNAAGDTARSAPGATGFAAGTTLERAWDAGFAVTNGPAWSRDGRTIWLNDSARGIVHRADFDPGTGRVASPRPWLSFAPGDGSPDGMTTDADGRLWIAHWGGACVSCHAPDDGRELARLRLPTDHITNVAFGGPALRTLYVSSAASGLDDARRAAQPLAGALFAVETDAAGVPAGTFAG